MVQVTCVECGGVLTAQRRSKRFCSPACRRAWGAAHRRQCHGCGREFTPARGTQRYCGAACRERAGRRRRYAERRRAAGHEVRGYSRTHKTGEPARCPVCRQVFTPARASQIYCGAACRRARANAARSRAAGLAPAARACELIARLHVPGADERCAECAQAWPCETRRLASMTAAPDDHERSGARA